MLTDIEMATDDQYRRIFEELCKPRLVERKLTRIEADRIIANSGLCAPIMNQVVDILVNQLISSVDLDEMVAAFERELVLFALIKAGGVQAGAARLLGVTDRSVWYLVKKHRIDVSKIRLPSDQAACF